MCKEVDRCSAECTFADFGAHVVGEIRQGGSISMRASHLTSNIAVDGSMPDVAASSTIGTPGGDEQYPTGGYRLEGCTLTGNSVPHEQVVWEAASAGDTPVVPRGSSDVGFCSVLQKCSQCILASLACVDGIVSPLSTSPEGMFLTPDHEQFVSMQKVRHIYPVLNGVVKHLF